MKKRGRLPDSRLGHTLRRAGRCASTRALPVIDFVDLNYCGKELLLL